MSETNMTAFVNGYAGLVNNYVITPVVQHLASRGVQISTEELMNVLQLPAQRAVPTGIYPNTGAPLAFGGAAPMMSPSVPPTKSKPRAPASIPPGAKLCNYKFKRGGSRGQDCGKATAGGSYCNGCLKSRRVGDDGGATAPGVAPAGGIPGALNANVAVNAAPVELAVEVYDQPRNLYRDTNTNIIIHQNEEATVLTAVGVHSDAENKMVPLTPAARQQASAMGLTVPDMGPVAPAVVHHAPVPQAYPSAVAHVPQAHTTYSSGYPVPPVPQVPLAIPSGTPVPHAPQVPFGVPSAVPSAFQVPQIPRQVQSQIPQMPQQMNIPQVPQQVHVPQVPQIPQQVQPQVPQIPQQMNIPQVPQQVQVPQVPQQVQVPQISQASYVPSPSVVPPIPSIPNANMPSIPQAR